MIRGCQAKSNKRRWMRIVWNWEKSWTIRLDGGDTKLMDANIITIVSIVSHGCLVWYELGGSCYLMKKPVLVITPQIIR